MPNRLRQLLGIRKIREAEGLQARGSLAEALALEAACDRDKTSVEQNIEETLTYWRACMRRNALDQHLLAGLDAVLAAQEAALAGADKRLATARSSSELRRNALALSDAKAKMLDQVIRTRRRRFASKSEEHRQSRNADAATFAWFSS